MRCCMAGLLLMFAAGPVLAQEGRAPLHLDSGSVVRLHWPDGREKARLLAPLEWDSTMVRYCRYPSPVCGRSTINPPRMRPVSELSRVEVRRGSRTVRGALIGAGFGTLAGLFALWARGLGDGPPLSSGQRALTVAGSAAGWSGFGALIGAMSDNWAAAP
jgi:hypothetical protein